MVIVGIVVAAVVSFVISAGLYAAPPIGALVARSSTARPGIAMPVQMLFVVLRGLVAATVLAVLLVLGDRHGLAAGAALGAIVAVLPVTILVGAVVHENVPIPVALVHMTDWVLKLVVSGAVVGLFA